MKEFILSLTAPVELLVKIILVQRCVENEEHIEWYQFP
jgi:hypothetical protein